MHVEIAVIYMLMRAAAVTANQDLLPTVWHNTQGRHQEIFQGEAMYSNCALKAQKIMRDFESLDKA